MIRNLLLCFVSMSFHSFLILFCYLCKLKNIMNWSKLQLQRDFSFRDNNLSQMIIPLTSQKSKSILLHSSTTLRHCSRAPEC